MTAKSLNALLQEKAGQNLAKLADKARQMVDLSSTIGQALPAELSSEIRGSNVREDGELVIIASSSSAAARLRFETDALLAAAQSNGHAVSRVSVRVARQA